MDNANLTPAELFRYKLKARNSLFWVDSHEERRVERELGQAALMAGFKVRLWDCATGVHDLEGTKIDIEDAEDPLAAFGELRAREATYENGELKEADRQVWIMRDLHNFLDEDPVILRALKSLARDLQDEPNTDQLGAIVVLCSNSDVPADLEGTTVMMDWPLPTRKEIRAVLDDILAYSEVELDEATAERVIDAAAGLAADDIAAAFAESLVRVDTVDPDLVAAQKEQIINRAGVLTWKKPHPLGMDRIGGLENLKLWLAKRSTAMSREARDFGLPTPRGVMLAGVPGCGKSQAAKCLATAWRLPLLHLDPGGLKDKYVGESEKNIRKALATAEAIAPCVLWVDESEKAIGGGDDQVSSGDVSKDALGAILNWMEERERMVFVVMTANDVKALPPELTRKGRLDGVFFVDLPNEEEAVAILRASLAEIGREENGLDLEGIAKRCTEKQFSGAEIFHLAPTALFTAFDDGQRALSTADVMAEIDTTVPMAQSDGERIKKLQDWGASRAMPASLPSQAKANGAPTGAKPAGRSFATIK